MLRPLVVDRFPLSAAPAALFAPLAGAPGAILLESAGGPAELCAWSFIACDPFLTLTARGDALTLAGPDLEALRAGVVPGGGVSDGVPGVPGGGVWRWRGDPFAALDALLAAYQVEAAPGLPPFCGGLAGYIAYDAGRCIERLPATARADLDLPDLWLCAYDAVAAIDHRCGEVWVLALPFPERAGAGEAAARALAAHLRAVAPGGELGAVPPIPGGEPGAAAPAGGPDAALALPPVGPDAVAPLDPPVQSNFGAAAYQAAVARAVAYIHAGDLFQVNLAQRFTAPLAADPFTLYRRLRQQSPAPFAAFLGGEGFQVLSASPERLLQVTSGGQVETRPIKGTRRRGATPAADAALARELLASEKEQAELLMIVDLERSDLGRVCRYGSVTVPALRRLEAHPTVWHTVATVAGELWPGVTAGRLLRATFPGGSVTGAPKVRAMQIIEELEGLRRGVYCGAIGYLAFSGEIDLNVVIRTLVCSDGRVCFHAGGGIVADSDPAAEYEETLVKAAALLRALGAPTAAPEVRS